MYMKGLRGVLPRLDSTLHWPYQVQISGRLQIFFKARFLGFCFLILLSSFKPQEFNPKAIKMIIDNFLEFQLMKVFNFKKH